MTGYSAIYRAVVVDNNDPAGQRRVRANVPQVMADQSTGWCDPAFSTDAPAPGTIVWVMFVNGDLSKPVYLYA